MAEKVTGSGRGSPKPAGRSGAGKPLTTDDNLSPAEKEAAALAARRAEEEAEAIQLMSVVAKAKSAIAAHEEKKAAAKLAGDVVNDVFRAAKLQSKHFERGRIMELINDSKPQARRNVTANEAVRTRFRKLMGLPVGQSDEEQELDARLPDVEREGAFWFQAGYSAGIAGHNRDATEECVRAGHDNRFDEGWVAGQAVLGNRVAADMQARKDAKAAAKAAEPTPEETAAQRRIRLKAEESKAMEGLKGMANVKGAAPETEGASTPAPEEPKLDEVQQAIKDEAEKPAGSEVPQDETPADGAEAV